jgi:hypothetical protein
MVEIFRRPSIVMYQSTWSRDDSHSAPFEVTKTRPSVGPTTGPDH